MPKPASHQVQGFVSLSGPSSCGIAEQRDDGVYDAERAEQSWKYVYIFQSFKLVLSTSTRRAYVVPIRERTFLYHRV